MSTHIEVPKSHPRYHSLLFREKIIDGLKSRVVTEAGLIAHGRGESLDYFLGESTQDFGLAAVKAAAALLLLAKKPVISVNGNAAALVPESLVALSQVTGAPLEVNLFYRTPGREEAVEALLKNHGAQAVLGVGADVEGRIPELHHERRRVSVQGILIADVVLVPLEDGDRTEALVNMGKTVITIDLNPLSRTAQKSQVTVVDNIVRCLPLLVETIKEMKALNPEELAQVVSSFDQRKNLSTALAFMGNRLLNLADEGSSNV